MRTTRLVGILIFILMIGCKSPRITAHSTIQTKEKILLAEDGPAEFFYWQMINSDHLWGSQLGQVSDLHLFRDSLKMVLGEQKLKEVIQKEETQSLQKSLLENEKNGDRINALLVHTGTLGNIRDINFLEAQILNYQMSKYPLLSKPTEFHGFITIDKKGQNVRVYIASSDTEWPPRPHVIIDQLEEDMKNGWKLKSHLHNHYSGKSGDYLGILAPSLADAQYYKMLAEKFNIGTALITNGYHTVEINQNEFKKFESH